MNTTTYTKGWIRMQVLSGIVDICRFAPGIASNDTELEHESVLLIMEYLSGKIGRKVEWNREKNGSCISVSEIVEYLEGVLNTPADSSAK
jgi:hypothetical protein